MQTIQRILIAYEVIEKMRSDGTDRDDASERIARDGAEIARAAGFDTTAEVISSTDDPADAIAVDCVRCCSDRSPTACSTRLAAQCW